MCKKYWIKNLVPCAEYPGLTLEGGFLNINLSEIKSRMMNSGCKLTYLEESGILICKYKKSDLYFYGDGKFILSRISSEEEGKKILEDIFC